MTSQNDIPKENDRVQQVLEATLGDARSGERVIAVEAVDEEVVQRVLGGESALFAILVQRHKQRLIRIARTIVRDGDEAEDVVQQAFVNAYVHLAQFAGRARFATWLTRIALNEARARAQRGRRIGWGTGIQEDAMASADRGLDPEQRVLAGELREALARAIDSLPRAYRVVFALRQVDGLSTFETAESLGVSEDVVKTRLHRARAQLRADLRSDTRAGRPPRPAHPQMCRA